MKTPLLLSSLLLSLLILPVSPLFAAGEREWVPYKKLVETTYLDKYYAVPAGQRDKVVMFAVLRPVNQNLKASDLVLTLKHRGGAEVMKVRPDGRLELVFRQQWLDENAMLFINQPKGEKVSVSMNFNAVMPEGLQWNYATFMGSVKQSNELIKKNAGVLSMFAPHMKSVNLKFAKPAQLQIQAKSGVTTVVTDARNQIRLKPDEALMQENPSMLLSEHPFEAELDD